MNGDEAMDSLFDGVDDVLREQFYEARPSIPKKVEPKRAKRATKSKPTHYKVICISLYKEDLGRLDDMVRELKSSGHRKMSRSALIRFALDTLDLDALPRSY